MHKSHDVKCPETILTILFSMWAYRQKQTKQVKGIID